MRPDFLRMTRRYGGDALLSVAFLLLPQPKPRYKHNEEPSAEEKLER